MKLKDLSLPFPAVDVEWRIAQSGFKQDGNPWAKCLAYISARAVMNRLDEVCGPENWRCSYMHYGQGVMCTLEIKCGDEWVAKVDGAEQTEFEAFKGGISSALKRAASVWGVGRYLYNLDEGFAEFVDKLKSTKDSQSVKIVDRKTNKEAWFDWVPPKLPSWALPVGKGTGEKTEPQALSTPAARGAVIKAASPAIKLDDGDGSLGDTPITVGKRYAGKRFKDVGAKELLGFCQVTQKFFHDKQKPITQEWQDFFSRVEAFWALSNAQTSNGLHEGPIDPNTVGDGLL